MRADVRRSIEAKAAEIGALREQTLRENAGVLDAAAAAARALARAGGCWRWATAGRRPTRWTSSRTCARAGGRALDLTEDTAVLTAIANDIGVEAIFSRQVIAHGRPATRC